MSQIITHGRSGPLSGRLDRLVSRAEAECRLAELDRRCKAGDAAPTCSNCGIFLLAKEIGAGICRHCADGWPPRD
jgi:hypothetical protein